MCCRYFIDDKVDEFAEYFEQATASPLAQKMVARLGRPLKTTGEINPTDMVPVIARDKKGTVRFFPMVWGFAPEGRRTASLFNARAESASEKPAFKDAWTSRRCIVPASYFFEWGPPPEGETVPLTKAGKARYVIQPDGFYTTWMAGLYRMETDGNLTYPSFTILTRDSAGTMRSIHDRMPVIFRQDDIEYWIDPEEDPKRIIKLSLTDLYVMAG